MMTQYVPAHTSADGNSSLSKTSKAVWYTTGGSVLQTVNGTHTTAQSYKSAATDGLYSGTFPGFRKPTRYVRSVLKTTDLSGGHELEFWNGFTRYRVLVDDARHPTWGVNCDTVDSAYTGLPTENINQRNRCVAEALNKVNDQRINLLVALGEARKTVNMIAERVRSLVRFYKALRRGNFSYAYYSLFGRSTGVQMGKTAAEVYLELQYGWRPLIDDIWGGVELIREGHRQKSLLFSVERTITDPMDPAALFGRPWELTTQGEAKESYKVKLWGSVTDNLLSIGRELGILNPLTLAWELTPYSFVIDWLVPVGAWLESLTSTIGVTFVAGFGTYVRAGNVTAVRNAWPSPYSAKRPPKVRSELFVMHRVPYDSWPWALPYIKSPFSTSHVTSAIALLRSARR